MKEREETVGGKDEGIQRKRKREREREREEKYRGREKEKYTRVHACTLFN